MHTVAPLCLPLSLSLTPLAVGKEATSPTPPPPPLLLLQQQEVLLKHLLPTATTTTTNTTPLPNLFMLFSLWRLHFFFYIYIYIYVYICICIYIYMCVCVCVYICKISTQLVYWFDWSMIWHFIRFILFFQGRKVTFLFILLKPF